MLKPLQKNLPILIVAGTRPEIIKLAPVYRAFKQHGHNVLFCASMQHQSLTADFLNFFSITPDFCLQVVHPGQSLNLLSSRLLAQLDQVLEAVNPQLILVQGDTMTAACAAMAGFLRQIKVVHIEAGLRTGDLQAPFPEEFNRKFCTVASNIHFAATDRAKQNLLAEGVGAEKIFVVGNTIVDALQIALQQVAATEPDVELFHQVISLQQQVDCLVLLTMHRREGFDEGLENLSKALAQFARSAGNKKLGVIYPKHPNPATDKFAASLGQIFGNKLCLLPPQGYAHFIRLLQLVDLVITDSGGTLEEACVLNKKVICLRTKTERQEALCLPQVQLSGYDTALILQALENALSQPVPCNKTLNKLFGDGNAALKIVALLEQQCGLEAQALCQELFIPSVSATECKVATVAVFGLGYIGLPTAIVLASSGFKVIGIDVDLAKLEQIRAVEIDFLEPELQKILQQVLLQETLVLTSKLDQPVDYFVVCVPTPLRQGVADISYVLAVVESISHWLRPGNLVLFESTVPVGTTEHCHNLLAQKTGLQSTEFFVAYCPERVLPGNIFKELICNDRVIGANHPTAFLLASKLYQSFCKGHLSWVNLITAELVKLLENSYRNLQVAFANEVFDIAMQLGVSATELIATANRHPRVKILNPGPGVGGHCIAVDPIFLSKQVKCPLLELAITQNQLRPKLLAAKIIEVASQLPGCKVLTLGLSYKPNVPDTRESPAVVVTVELMRAISGQVVCFDPLVKAVWHDELKVISLSQTQLASAVLEADILVILVAHDSFVPFLNELNLSNKIIFDPTGFLSKLSLKTAVKSTTFKLHEL